ncbi:hypothetical protein TNCV_5102321 [Trichonephila clavipes]|nr:hypothetical protein TNCV_5102321 [Trichonephila clavipes]
MLTNHCKWQYGAVWSMGHTQQVCVRIVLIPSNVWQQFFGRSAFLRQQETDLPPAELWCACTFLLIGRCMSSAGIVLLTRPPPCRLLHIPVVLNDFHSRETTLSTQPSDLSWRHPPTRTIKVVKPTKYSNQRHQTHLTQQPKSSDSLDATPPMNSYKAHAVHARQNKKSFAYPLIHWWGSTVAVSS